MIIAFTKDWGDVPTCTTHILREMAKTIPVLWVESIGTRKPSLVSGSRDIGRVRRRLKLLFRGAEWKENHLWVLSPFLIPKPTRRWQVLVNRILFYLQERAALRKMKRRLSSAFSFQLSSLEYWPFVPNAVDLLPKPHPITHHPSPITHHRPLVVYFCVDDWEKFHNLDAAYLGRKERELVARSDIIFTPAKYLVDKLERLVMQLDGVGRGVPAAPISDPSACGGARTLRPTCVFHVPHGVEYGKFAAALDPATRIPDDVASLPHPVIGFYGNLHPWVDLDVLEHLIALRPSWSFVVIGHPYVSLSRFDRYTNAHFLGRREHDTLPAYCRAFDAAIIPYDLNNPRMDSVNPVKTRELLAAGVPVVAVDIPELRGFGDEVLRCRNRDEWLPAIERQLARTDRAAVSATVRNETWPRKVAEMRRMVAESAEGPGSGDVLQKAAKAAKGGAGS